MPKNIDDLLEENTQLKQELKNRDEKIKELEVALYNLNKLINGLNKNFSSPHVNTNPNHEESDTSVFSFEQKSPSLSHISFVSETCDTSSGLINIRDALCDNMEEPTVVAAPRSSNKISGNRSLTFSSIYKSGYEETIAANCNDKSKDDQTNDESSRKKSRLYNELS